LAVGLAITVPKVVLMLSPVNPTAAPLSITATPKDAFIA